MSSDDENTSNSTMSESVKTVHVNSETKHLIVQTNTEKWYIVSTLKGRSFTRLFQIERYTGHLLYNAQPGVDIFNKPEEALKYIAVINGGEKFVRFKTVIAAEAIIGYFIVHNISFLLLSTKSETTMTLPPNHEIKTIREIRWVRIEHAFPNKGSKLARNNMEDILSYPFEHLHYYCETLDLTRLYPSAHAVHDHEAEFSWNEYMASEFTSLQCRDNCIVLMQGIASEKSIKHKDINGGNFFHVAVFYKRSSWNPGTRYQARGLNEVQSPGNEYECEQIVWTSYEKDVKTDDTLNIQDAVNSVLDSQEGTIQSDDTSFKYSRYMWRRGSVPIHWTENITNMSNAVKNPEIIIDKNPFKGIEHYYSRLLTRYGYNQHITLLSLLRNKRSSHHSEHILSEKYRESIEELKKRINIHVDLYTYDWLTNKKENKLATVEELWQNLKNTLFSNESTEGIISANSHKVAQTQKGFVRVNCADSLDRTNLVCFYISIQVIAEQFRKLGIDILNTNEDIPSRNNPFPLLQQPLEKVKVLLNEHVARGLSEMFLEAGDVCSELYTNTAAMHTAELREFIPHSSNAIANVKLIVERRMQNVLHDVPRQHRYEMLLGINHEFHFPQAAPDNLPGKVRLISTPNTYILESAEDSDMMPEKQLFTFGSITQIPNGVVAIPIMLPCHCQLTSIALTLTSVEHSPDAMDVYVGEHVDDMVVAFKQVILPKCLTSKKQIKVMYELPPHVSGIKEPNNLYSFKGKSQQCYIRVVRLIFYGVEKLNFGQIQLYGIQHLNSKMKSFPEHLFNMEVQNSLLNIEMNIDSVKDGEFVLNVESKPEDESQEIGFHVGDELVGSLGNIAQLEKEQSDDEEDAGESETAEEDEDIVEPVHVKTMDTSHFNHELAQFLEDHHEPIESMDSKEAKNQYIDFLNETPPTSFNAVLQLDLARIILNLTPAERDDLILKNSKYDMNRYDPNVFVFKLDERVERMKRKHKATNHCNICKASLNLFRRKYVCRYCRYTHCKNCTSKEKYQIKEYDWKDYKQVCILCADKLSLTTSLLKRISNLLPKSLALQASNLQSKEFLSFWPNSLLKDREMNSTLVSLFPHSTILNYVESGENKVPIESILWSPDNLPDNFFHTKESTIYVTIVLENFAILSHFLLLVDNLGYSDEDTISIEIQTGERNNSLSKVGVWQVGEQSAGSVVRYEMPLQPMRFRQRIVFLKIQNVRGGIHLGRFQVHGRFEQVETPMRALVPEPMEHHRRSPYLIINTERKFTKDGNSLMLDLYIRNRDDVVEGFFMVARHHSMYGIRSCIKDIRISALHENDKGEALMHEFISTVTLPLTGHQTRLYFPFRSNHLEHDKPPVPTGANIVRFEFLSNYGAPELSLQSLGLFKKNPNYTSL